MLITLSSVSPDLSARRVRGHGVGLGGAGRQDICASAAGPGREGRPSDSISPGQGPAPCPQARTALSAVPLR